jgi:hypothetical protein
VRENDRWGQARVIAKNRGLRLRVFIAVVIMLAFPFLLDAASRLYVNMGGTMPGGAFPRWLPLGFWAAEITVAAGVAILVFRGSDEFQRQALIEAGAMGGSVLMLLTPPFLFMGQLFGSHQSDAILALWATAFASGALTYRIRLARHWA